MSTEVRRKLQRAENVQAFSLANPSPNPAYMDDVATLDTLLDEAGVQVQFRATHGKGTTTAKKVARTTLIEVHMVPVVTLARSWASIDPVIAKEIGAVGHRAAEKDLATRATAIVEVAAKAEARFIASGLPADFVVTFREAIAKYEAAVLASNQARAARAGAREELKDIVGKLDEVVGRLNAINLVRFRTNPEALGAWKSALKLLGPSRRPVSAAVKAAKQAKEGTA